MAEEIKPEVIKKTQRSLGKYVKKPPLTEKLLRKPPFRFLHDIVTAVIKETGFLDNLFSEEELNSDVRDKEAKIAFLTKLINVVSNDLKVRPTKVIAGLEPAKTNELLQAIAKALDKNINSSEAVNHYKASLEKDSSNLPKSRESKQDAPKSVASKSNMVAEPKKASTRKEKERTDIISKKDTASNRKSKQVRKGKSVVDDSAQRRDSVDVSMNNANVDHKSSVDNSKRSAKTKIAQIELDEAPETKLSQSPLEDQKRSDDIASETIKIANVPEPREENYNGLKNTQNVPGDIQLSEKPPETAQPSVSDKEVSALKDSSSLVHGRPASARPAAPKIRWKLNIGERPSAPDVPETDIVMVGDFDDRNDDKESMVVLETDANDYTIFKDRSRNLNADNTQEHGYLVAQILETQRELAKTDTIDLIPNKNEAEPERSSVKNSEAIAKEVDKLRGTIQTLTRATHPMGKLLDFLQEDVELMEKELSEWQNQSGQLAAQLEKEKSESEAAVQPLKETFNGIQASIDDQLNKIYQIKFNIMRNNHKIQQLLSGRS